MSSPYQIKPSDILFASHDWESYIRPRATYAAKRELAKRELARRDLLHFVKYFKPNFTEEKFQVYVCKKLMTFLDDLIAGKDPCLIIEAPPRHGKSLICSDMLPSFALGYLSDHFPAGVEVIHIGYNKEFISEFGGKNRDRMQNSEYLNLFPAQEARNDHARVDHVITHHNDVYHCAGMNSAITGFGSHLLIIDDPIKGIADAQSDIEVRKQIEGYQANISTRGMEKTAKLMMLTRWSNFDVAGYVQEMGRKNPEADQWEVIKFPAIATEDNDILGRMQGEALCPNRFPLSRLRRERAGKTAKVWSAMYQQNPVPDTGGFFEASDIEACITPMSEYPDISEMYLYIPGDFAIGTKAKNDYTVFWPFGVTEDNHIWFLNDMARFKGGGHKIISELLRLGKKYQPRAMILEDGAIFRGFRDTLDQRMRETHQIFYIDAPYPTKDKLARAEPLRARVQQHMVHFPDTSFMKDIVFKEMMAFGEDSMGVHDDTVDAAATGVMRLTHLRGWRSKNKGTTKLTGPLDIGNMNMEQIKALHKKQTGKQNNRRGLVRIPQKLNGHDRLTRKPR